MAKTRKKHDLPSKHCGQCGKSFTWRRKWARDWPCVIYCSKACRSAAKRERHQ